MLFLRLNYVGLGERKLLKKTVSGIMLTLLLMGTLTLAFDVQLLQTYGGIARGYRFESGLLSKDFGIGAFGAVSEQDLELAKQRCFERFGGGFQWVTLGSSENYLSVPFRYQKKLYWCGPAALEMIFDYFEEGVLQFEVAEVARSYPMTTYADELRRAAHFSELSTSMGSEMPTVDITGYFARKLGYAAFEQWGMMLGDLRALVDSGYPVVVLMWYSPAHIVGHFRVVVGYNETHMFVHDPYNNVEWGGAYGGPNLALENSVFLDLWHYSGYRGLFVSPWDVSISAPSDVQDGDTFTIGATVAYPCPYPFPTGAYSASSCNASIRLFDGLSLVVGETAEKTLGTGSLATGASAVVNWTVRADNPGSYEIWVEAEGLVSGSVSPKTSPTYLPSYNYQDRIGGIGQEEIEIKEVDTSWPTFHHDLRRTGYSWSKAPENNQTLWSYATGGRMLSSPAVADGKIYMGSEDGKIYCLNATTGEHIWNYTTGSYVFHCPTVVDDKVYIGSWDHKVYCLNAKTGVLIWNYTVGGWVESCPAVADCRVFVSSGDNKIYCLNATTGEHIWNYTTSSSMYSSPAVVDGKVYIGSEDYKLYALNASTGAPIWSYTTGDCVWSSPAVAYGKVYAGSWDNKIYCFGSTGVIRRDVALINVSCFSEKSYAGQSVSVVVQAKNNGTVKETFQVTTYYDSSPIATRSVTDLPSNGIAILTFSWDTTNIPPGIYTIRAEATTVPNETNTANNQLTNGMIQIIKHPTATFVYTATIVNQIVTFDATKSSPNGGQITDYLWDFEGDGIFDTSGPIVNHTYTSIDWQLPNLVIIDTEGLSNFIWSLIYATTSDYTSNIAVTDVTPSENEIVQGYTVNITVDITNTGNFTEIFNVAVYADTTIIGTLVDITLESGSFTIITFTWNTTGFAKGNYTIWAYAWPVQGEKDVADNTHTNSWILVTFPGDVNGDGKVRVDDVLSIALAFGSNYGDPEYNPNLDINYDGKIRVDDVLTAALNFGQG